MKINIEDLINNSLEWEQASEEIKKSFEEYLDKFFNVHKGRNEVPLTFKEWTNSDINNRRA